MIDLAYFRSRILYTLQDATGIRYPNPAIDEALNQALAEYSNVFPQVITSIYTFTVTGQEHNLSGISGSPAAMTHILDISYPYTGQLITPKVEGFYHYTTAGSPMVCFTPHQARPQAGEQALIRTANLHTIQNLNSAPITTVPYQHHNILITGSAGKAALMRSSGISEAYNSRASDDKKIINWAQYQLSLFKLMLDTLKRDSALKSAPYQESFWKLDRWDK